jgi:hypothetical protein
MLAEPGDLVCQKCRAIYQWRGTRAKTEAAARFRQWRVFEGITLGGSELKVVLCPDCSGVEKKARHRRYEPIDGQEPFNLQTG